MAKNKKSVNKLIQDLAQLSDNVDKIFPNGKKILVFELEHNDFNSTKLQFENYDPNLTKFNVDISGVEFVFIQHELSTTSEDKS